MTGWCWMADNRKRNPVRSEAHEKREMLKNHNYLYWPIYTIYTDTKTILPIWCKKPPLVCPIWCISWKYILLFDAKYWKI